MFPSPLKNDKRVYKLFKTGLPKGIIIAIFSWGHLLVLGYGILWIAGLQNKIEGVGRPPKVVPIITLISERSTHAYAR